LELLILVLLSVVQSIIGVGVLLFGTPVFLMLGYDFFEVLILLLPISITVSVSTVLHAGVRGVTPAGIILLTFTIAIGTWFALERSIDILTLLVGLSLVFSSLLHFARSDALTNSFAKDEKVAMPVIGIIHGFTNQGGALLLWWSGVKTSDKNEARSLVAFSYGLMASIQLATVLLVDGPRVFRAFEVMNLIVPLLSYIAGSIMFARVPGERYRDITNLFVGGVGMIILTKVFTEYNDL